MIKKWGPHWNVYFWLIYKGNPFVNSRKSHDGEVLRYNRTVIAEFWIFFRSAKNKREEIVFTFRISSRLATVTQLWFYGHLFVKRCRGFWGITSHFMTTLADGAFKSGHTTLPNGKRVKYFSVFCKSSPTLSRQWPCPRFTKKGFSCSVVYSIGSDF